MNPPVLMSLVELIRGMATSQQVRCGLRTPSLHTRLGLPFTQTYDTACAFARHLGKTTCTSLDRPGFIVNRILMPMINEAFYTLMEVCILCVAA